MSIAVSTPHKEPSLPGRSRSAQTSGLTLKGRTAQILNGKLVLVDAHAGNGNLSDGTEEESGADVGKDGSGSDYQDEGDDEEDMKEERTVPRASTSRATTPASASTSRKGSAGPRPSLVRKKTRYHCTWEGCTKSYAKPVRLSEHLRSHTGERPFVCTHPGCDASYLRDTHLAAHLRTHLDEKDKPFICTAAECDKRFWTNQHLNRHVKLVHELNEGAYKCDQCDAAFNKHNKLRDHVSQVHMPEGTKPFICPEPGCGKSYLTGSKLRTHAKTHDQNRYVCMHPSHFAPSDVETDNEAEGHAAEGRPQGPPKFPTWSALREHNKLEHPPMCPHSECNGRVFKSGKKLRRHLIKAHLDTLEPSGEDTVEEAEGHLVDVTDDHGTETAGSPHASNIGLAQLAELATIEGHKATGSQQPLSSAVQKGRLKRRSSSELIPTQPVDYPAFDGNGDYQQEGVTDAEESPKGIHRDESPSDSTSDHLSKKVRFD